MKQFHHLTFLAVATVLAAAVGSFSCTKPGKAVQLTVLSGWLQTRTAYSGVTDGEGMERIDWGDGDRITIACAACEGPVSADYLITGSTIQGNGARSQAKIAPADGNGLTWGTGTHDFYALYPGAAAFDAQDREKVSLGTDGLVRAFIPAVQRVTAGTSVPDGSTTVQPLLPDMRHAFMWAGRQTSPVSEVSLSFTPMVTTFRFSVEGDGLNGDVTLNGFELVSTSCALSGSFSAQIAVDGADVAYTVPAFDAGVGTANDRISATLPEGIAIGTGKQVQLTVFVLPASRIAGKEDKIRDLTLRFFTSAGNRSLALKYADSAGGDFVEFPACRKIHINHLTLPTQLKPWSFTVYDVEDLDPKMADVVVEGVAMEDFETGENASSGTDVEVEDLGEGSETDLQ